MVRACVLALVAGVTFVASVRAEVRSLKLASGELLVHAFDGGVPLPAESRWTRSTGAGPSFVPEGDQHRLNWNVFLQAKGAPNQLRDVVRATVQEVSGAQAVTLYDGPPRATEKGLMIVAPGQIVSRDSYPWLYTSDSTLLVLRVSLFRANERDLLLQPILIGDGVKQKLKASGYLR